MGGFNSGWHRGGKSTIEDHRSVDIRRWHRDGLLEPQNAPKWSVNSHKWQWTRDGRAVASIIFNTAPDHVKLIYTQTRQDHKLSVDQRIEIDWMPLHFGGYRPWFQCPDCSRRVAILYLIDKPACRHCKRLTYRSRNETDTDRYTSQLHKMQERFGGSGGALGDIGIKPKGMHWQTWHRLQCKHDDYRAAAMADICARFNDSI